MTLPSCISTHPRPILDASQYTSKGFVISGIIKIGAEINLFLSSWKLASHLSVHSNFLSFFSNWVMGLANSRILLRTCGNIPPIREMHELGFEWLGLANLLHLSPLHGQRQFLRLIQCGRGILPPVTRIHIF